MVLEFTKLEYRKMFFNRTNLTQCHGGKTNEELEFLKLEFLKKWYFAIYFRNSVFLLKISKICDIWPSHLGTDLEKNSDHNQSDTAVNIMQIARLQNANLTLI